MHAIDPTVIPSHAPPHFLPEHNSNMPSPVDAAQPSEHIYLPVTRLSCDRPSRFESADSPTYAFPEATPPYVHEAGRTSDFLSQLNARLLRTCHAHEHEGDGPESESTVPLRSNSFFNMTSSTLFGIYDAAADNCNMAETPSEDAAETPPHSVEGESGVSSPNARPSIRSRPGELPLIQGAPGKNPMETHLRHRPWKYAVISGKLAALYFFGTVYGLIVSQLHEAQPLAAVHVQVVYSRNCIYLASWGFLGLVLGSLLPYIDLVWHAQISLSTWQRELSERTDSPLSEQINDVVRSVCAFVGISFAIRRLPWQSTLQLTLTLALVNPVLWYILDRSRTGLFFSLLVTSLLTSFIFLANSDALPSSAIPSLNNLMELPFYLHSSLGSYSTSSIPGTRFMGVVSYENLAVITWVGSVIFCSCVCFGNIGRRLGVLHKPVAQKMSKKSWGF